LRIDIVVSGVPKKELGASSRIFWQYIWSLVKYEFDVRLVSLTSNEQEELDLVELETELSSTGNFRAINIRLPDIVIQSKRIKIEVDVRAKTRVSAVLRKDPANIVIIFDLSAALVTSDEIPGRKIIWLGDLASEVNWYDGIIRARKGNPINILRFVNVLIRQRQLHSLYRKVLDKSFRIIVASHSSLKTIEKLGFSAVFLPYPWPRKSHTDIGIPAVKSKEPRFIMFGNLSGLGFRSQWDFLFTKIYPRAKKVFGPGKFTIEIGGINRAPQWLNSEISKRPEIKWLGLIEDLESAMVSAHATLVPLSIPVGNRTRIVTAQANRCLVIAHKNVSAGNPFLVHGFNCLLGEASSEFVAHMVKAYRDNDFAKIILDNAEDFYMKTYATEVANKNFINLILSCIPHEPKLI
jgi:hypothetical protein